MDKKNEKDETLAKNLRKVAGPSVTAGICFSIYRWGAGHEKICFAITLGSIAYLILCFYNVVFNKPSRDMAQKIISVITIIAFANELYDYNNIVTLFPILKNVEPVLFSLILMGVVLVVFITFRVVMIIIEYNETDTNNNVPSSRRNNKSYAKDREQIGNKNGITNNIWKDGDESPIHHERKGGENNGADDDSSTMHNREEIISENNYGHKVRESNAWMVIYFVFLLIIIGGSASLLTIFREKGILNQDYDYFEIVTLLIKHAGSILMFLIAVFFVIVLLIEMIRLIISRMKAFAAALRNERNGDTPPLYLLSVIVDVIVCYLTYKFTRFDMDSFYEIVKGGKYLALPLTLLFIGITFIVFLRLIHATLLLLMDMKLEQVKQFLEGINKNNNITARLIEIIRIIFDIILETILTAFRVVYFIPDFLGTICRFVLEDEEDFEQEEKKCDG